MDTHTPNETPSWHCQNLALFGVSLTCINILLVAKMPMLELGRTWRARVQRRLMKARARCWETCFLRLVSMTSRHWSTISTPSLVAPETADRPFITSPWSKFTCPRNPSSTVTGPTSGPSPGRRAVLHLQSLLPGSRSPCLTRSYIHMWHWQASTSYTRSYFSLFIGYHSGRNIFVKELFMKDTLSKHTYLHVTWTVFCRDVYRTSLDRYSEHHLLKWQQTPIRNVTASKAKANKTWLWRYLTLPRKNMKSGLDTMKTFLIA